MSVAETIRTRIKTIKRGQPFTTSRFLKLGTRSAVDKTISRLVKEGVVQRLTRGVFIRPETNPFTDNVMPGISEIIKVIAKNHGETIEVHGAEAARRFKLSTQMPTTPVFYTNGPARKIKIGNMTVKLMHTTSHRRLQFAGQKIGLALSALFYLGKNNVNPSVIQKVKNGLSHQEFETLKTANVPAWMSDALNAEKSGSANA